MWWIGAAFAVEVLDPLAYHQQLVGVEQAAVIATYASTRRMLANPDRSTVDRWFREVDAELDTSIARISALPARSDDEGLREAVLASFQHYERWLAGSAPEVFELLVHRERVREADVGRTDGLLREMEAMSQADRAAVVAAQERYAARHALSLIPPTEAADHLYDRGPASFGPGVPPAGSALSAAQHASFSLRYYNEVIELQRAALVPYNAFAVAAAEDPAACEARRRGAVAAVASSTRSVAQLPPWFGDTGPRSALATLLDDLEVQLGTTFEDFCALLVRETRTQAEVDAVNTAYTDGNDHVSRSIAGFDEAMRQFSARFGVEAYDAWRRQR